MALVGDTLNSSPPPASSTVHFVVVSVANIGAGSNQPLSFMPLQPQTRLGPYVVTSLIGAGGMGEVYRARDTRLDRDVALKVLPPALAVDEGFRERFEREARSIASLSHPHICGLYDVGRHDGVDYLVIEYLDGQTLADRLRKGALPVRQALQYGAQIADALARAHRAGIVHRDLKPGNVMLTRDGVKLLDFGLAKATPGGSAGDATLAPTALTSQGMVLGTPHYMAPEGLDGRDVDTRTDIFALGVVLYEMLAGERPFHGTSPAQLVASILERTPKPLGETVTGLPPAVIRAVDKALAKDPDARWQSAADLRDELQWSLEALATQAGTAFRVGARWKSGDVHSARSRRRVHAVVAAIERH
jgi:serine/threonine protein kinase